MKLLKVSARNFMNHEISINLVPENKYQDKRELIEIDKGLYVYRLFGITGFIATGKTIALKLLDTACSLLEEFKVSTDIFYQDTEIEIYFYHKGYIYRYSTVLNSFGIYNERVIFDDELIFKKPYVSKETIFIEDGFEEYEDNNYIPENTSVMSNIFYQSDNCHLVFDKKCSLPELIDKYSFEEDLVNSIIFSFNVKTFKLNELSSGTQEGTKLFLYAMLAIREGKDLLVDDIDAYVYDNFINSMFRLFRSEEYNPKKASLIFTARHRDTICRLQRNDNSYKCPIE
ncbi:MAG: hypothetical protein ACI4WM_05450 [Erysipelotrichaceae bacterium]